MKNKLIEVCKYLKKLNRVVVAFSGGIDSCLLLKCGKLALGDRVLAVTLNSVLLPDNELKMAIDFCKEENINHLVLDVDVMSLENFSENTRDRCYICKRFMFSRLVDKCKELGYDWVVEGSNLDDNKDYRPGMRAIAELGILSPLRDNGLTKNDVRQLAKFLELDNWAKPSSACLASRIAYGESITEEKLYKIAEGERLLHSLGFKQLRLRTHNNLARLEVNTEDFGIVMSNLDFIVDSLKNIGFDFVTLDLQGFKSGSMNRLIEDE